MDRLPNRRRAFIHHYLRTWNATESARKAGYRGVDHVLHMTGSRLLSNDKVKKAIQARLNKMQVSSDEVIARLADQAKSDLSPFIRTRDDQGNPLPKPYVDIEAIIKSGKGHMIRELAYTKTGDVVVKTYDQQKALELLGRAHGVFKDRTELTGKDGSELFKAFIGIDPDKV